MTRGAGARPRPARTTRSILLAVGWSLVVGCLAEGERSFKYGGDSDEEILYVLEPHIATPPRSEYTLHGDCRLVRAEVYGGSPLKRIGDAVEWQLSQPECEDLIRSVVNTGFLDSDREARNQRLRRVLYHVSDSKGVFIRLRLMKYSSRTRKERRPFEEHAGATTGLVRRVPPIDEIDDEQIRQDLFELLSQNDGLLGVWEHLDRRYGPDAH